jgi:patatin-like phospholipase/acyl hydrolase
VADPRYRILSLDGGGIRGVMTAFWLEKLERELGGRLADHFDLVAGTSTGAILACAVSAGIPASRIVDLYHSKGQNVFPPRLRRWASRSWRLLTDGPSAPRYDGKGLEGELRRIFRTRKFGRLRIRPTLVTSYNTLEREALVFKNTKPEHASLDVWRICMASTAAPTYFPGHVVRLGRRRVPLIDGGVVANNPTACAIAEAVNQQAGRADRVPLEAFIVASFGTGAVTRPIEIRDTAEWGAVEWAIPVIGVLFDGAGDAVDYVARRLVSRDRYFRFQTELTVASDDMDDASPENVNRLLNEAARHLGTEDGEEKMRRLAALIA